VHAGDDLVVLVQLDGVRKQRAAVVPGDRDRAGWPGRGSRWRRWTTGSVARPGTRRRSRMSGPRWAGSVSRPRTTVSTSAGCSCGGIRPAVTSR
jgi:hypothetical protein